MLDALYVMSINWRSICAQHYRHDQSISTFPELWSTTSDSNGLFVQGPSFDGDRTCYGLIINHDLHHGLTENLYAFSFLCPSPQSLPVHLQYNRKVHLCSAPKASLHQVQLRLTRTSIPLTLFQAAIHNISSHLYFFSIISLASVFLICH